MNLGKGKEDMGNKLKIVFATGNIHKLQEINNISKNSEIEFILPPEGFNPKENGKDFLENSYIKAKEASRLSGEISLADDSGLCIDALGGEPGLYSARYDKTPELRIKKVLKKLKNENNRKAKFVCAMTLVDKNGEILTQTIGQCQGKITFSPKGENGFGYDPIFEVDNYNITMAQMSEELKNKISHRSVALQKILSYVNTRLI